MNISNKYFSTIFRMFNEKFYSRRSNVLATHGAVATSDPIASEIGLSLLKNGANAAEAAVGVAAVLNLVDPGMTGLGGDCFVLFYDNKLKTVKGINGRFDFSIYIK